MTTIIGLKELRQNATEIAERAQKGERFTVVKRSKPVFTISPPAPESNLADTERWTSEYIQKNTALLKSLADK